jgi:TonB family protein
MTWWQYLMLVNIYLLLFYSFYALLLSRETFFQLNRIYLVAAALLSFFIPVIQADWVKNLFITQKVQYTIYSSTVLNYRLTPMPDTHFTIGQALTVVYLSVIIFLLARFAWQLLALKRIISNPAPSAAYSFFKKINIGDEHEDNRAIAAHENVHAAQWHSADVLIMEMLVIVNWFNPVVYFYKFAIKHIHEFIADSQAIKSGTDKGDYAMILLGQTFNTPTHRLVNPFFNQSLLKQRIVMLQKSKSQRVRLFKYFLSAPLFMLMLILSSATVNNSRAIHIINAKVERVLLIAPGISSPEQVTQWPARKPNLLKSAYRKTAITSGPKYINVILSSDTTPKKNGPVFTAVEQLPGFPGGVTAFGQFLSKNIRYPEEARQQNVQGRVIVSFIVETDGTLSNFKIRRDIGDGAGEEAVRVLALSPKWVPGMQNGHKVRVAYAVPISYTLSPDEPAVENKKGAVNSQNNNIVINQNAAQDTGKNSVNHNIKSSIKGQLILSGGSPLYIVDDVQVDNLNNLKPEDIQSVSVLKDKPSTALYGEKGKNGVVIVITKGYALKHKPVSIIKN